MSSYKIESPYKCCQCRNIYCDDYEMYRTFFDSDTIGHQEWRICKLCSNENHSFNVQLFIVFIIIAILMGVIKYFD